MSPEFQSMVIYGLIASVLTGLVTALVWFVVREVKRKDRIEATMASLEASVRDNIEAVTNRFFSELRLTADRNTNAIERLNQSISQLAIELGGQRAFIAENYVSKPDHEKAIEVIHGRLSKHAEKLDNLGPCPDQCGR